jgi:hypothetical protein
VLEQRKSYWPEFFVACGLGFAGFLFVFRAEVHISAPEILTWLGSMLSTFVGAWLAFAFNNMKSDRENTDRDVVAGNLAISTVAEFWDRQTQYRREVVNNYRNRWDAWLNMPVANDLDSVGLSLNRNDLAFLLQTKGSVWQQITMEERRYRLLAKLINDRHEIILNQAWPRMVAAGMQIGGAIELNALEALLGAAIVQRLRVITAAIISNIDENVGTSWAAYEALREALLRIFPDKKFIRFVPNVLPN